MTPEGSLFLNVGAKPTDPWIPLEVAQVGAAALQAAEHDSLGQVDCHRPGCRRAVGRASIATSRSATTSRSTATGSSTTATSSSFTSRRAAGRRLDRRAVGVPYQDRVEHHALGRRPATACAAAATRGSFRTRRSRAATAIGRTRRRSRRRCPEQCLRLHGAGARRRRARPVPRPRQLSASPRPRAGTRLRRHRDGRALPARKPSSASKRDRQKPERRVANTNHARRGDLGRAPLVEPGSFESSERPDCS